MWQRGGARKENCGRERACTREGEDGEEGVVVVVDRNDDEKQRRRTQSDQQLLTQKHTNSTTQITEWNVQGSKGAGTKVEPDCCFGLVDNRTMNNLETKG